MIKDIIRKLRVNALHGIANIRAGSIEPKESLLIIAPHPDDEVIGCAGLIQRSLNKGNDVYVIILTGGEASHNGCCGITSQELITARRGLAININRKLGIPTKIYFSSIIPMVK